MDLNRNYTEYTRFDGAWVGASASCTSDSYSGPSEASEPETKNDMWIADTFPNIKFASNMHSFGGYFMWSPGAYLDDGKRTTSPAPNIGVEKYFFQAGEKILGRIKEFRGTVILPERTGPIADVLYSGAGSSADDHWYRKGIIGYGFETGADRFVSTETGTQQIQTGFQPPFGDGDRRARTPRLANEGRDQAMEFASGNFGMIEAAYDYALDTTPPQTSIEYSAAKTGGEPVNFTVQLGRRGGGIRYTTDGSTPTLASPHLQRRAPARPRRGADDRQARRHRRQVVRDGHQGQPVRGADAALPDRGRPEGRQRRRHRAGDAVADAGRSGHVRRVHAGRRQGVHGVHDGHGDLDRR